MRYLLVFLALFLISTISISTIKNQYIPPLEEVEIRTKVPDTNNPIPTITPSTIYITPQDIRPTPVISTIPDEINTTQILSKADYDSLLARSNEALQYIKDRRFDKLSEVTHSSKGVTFFPYYSHPDSMRKLNKIELKNFLRDTKVHIWGQADGSGLPIEKTNDAYYKSSIFDHDYTNAEKVGVDTQYSYGNFSNLNVLVNYISPETHFVEYYFSGFNADFQGMDWTALTLAFIKENNKWSLVGIYHGMWLI